MTPRAGRAGQAVQPDLFGVDHLVPTPRGPAGSGLTDLDLVASVVKAADDPGYVLIGPADKVHLHDGRADGSVEPVPAYESDAVAQLLASGHLTVGGHQHVRAGEHEGPARSVLVPKATRALVARWGALRPLTAPPVRPPSQPPPTDPAPGPTGGTPARPSSGPIVVDVVRPGLGLVTCRRPGDFSGSITREDGRYLVETDDGQVIGRAKSYRAGAALLARHHGFTPGPIEVDHERDDG